MQIKSINIGKYGRFTSKSFELKDGINLITGRNGSGKSTILAFIFYMLYGSCQNAYEDGGAEGSMLALWRGDEYLIERVCDGFKESCTITETRSGRTCFEGKEPGDVFLGISADAFKSACFAEKRGGIVLNDSLIISFSEKLASLSGQSCGVEQTLKRIDEAEEEFKRHYTGSFGDDHDDLSGKGALEDIKTELESEFEDVSRLNSELLCVDGKLKETERNLSYNAKRKRSLERQTEVYAARLKRKRFSQIASLKEKYKAAYERRNSFIEEHSKNGFFPDDDYLNRLCELSDSIEGYDERMAEINELISKSEDRAPVVKERMSGKASMAFHEASDRIAERIKKNKFLFSFGMLLIALTVAALGFTFFFFSVSTLFGIISAIGTVFLALGAIASVVISIGFKLGRKELYEKQGAQDVSPNDVSDAYDAYYDEEASTFDIDRERLILEREEIEGARATASMRLCEQYSRWGESLDETIDEVSLLLREYRGIDDEVKSLKDELELAEEQYKALDKAELSDELASLRLDLGFDIQKAVREYEFLQKADESLAGSREELQGRLSEMDTIGTEAKAELFEKMYSVRESIAIEKCVSDAYKLAHLAVLRSGEELKRHFSPKIFERAGEYLSKLTEGSFCRIASNEKQELVLYAPNGEAKSICALGGGVSDIVYLSLRMSFLSAIIEENEDRESGLPFMLDDELARLDPETSKTALTCLEAFVGGGSQVLLTSSGACGSADCNVNANLIKI